MAGITLAAAEARLDDWLAAEAALASSGAQSYTISTGSGSRTLTRVDLGEIRNQIDYWQGWVNRLGRGGIRVGRMVARHD